MKEKQGTRENVQLVITHADGQQTKVKGRNLVTEDGDLFYSQKIVGETSTAFNTPSLVLGTGTVLPAKTDTNVSTPIPSSNKEVDAGFPQRNNQDAGNAGGGETTITWKFSYPLGAVVATEVSEGAIVDDGAAPAHALNHFLFSAAFDITDTDQLTLYVNHLIVGI